MTAEMPTLSNDLGMGSGFPTQTGGTKSEHCKHNFVQFSAKVGRLFSWARKSVGATAHTLGPTSPT